MRSNAFFSVGQANQKGLEGQYGNANTEIVYDDWTGSFRINVYLPPEPSSQKGRVRREEDWVTVRLAAPACYRNLLVRLLAKGEAYTVRVVQRDGRFDCLQFPRSICRNHEHGPGR